MKIVLTGGGTGGHLFPALALAEEFTATDKNCKILFIGSSFGIERDIVPKYGYPIEFLDITGFKDNGWLNKSKTGLKAAKGVLQAARILKSFRPDGVIGTGGYSSGPVVLAARILNIKTAILEQNAMPGLTNRILGRFANRIYVAFEESKRFFPGGRVIAAGNPVRKDILRKSDDRRQKTEDADRKFTILIFGGSQGAKAINAAFLDALEYLSDIRDCIKIIHQTGDRDYMAVKETYARKGVKADVFRFIDDMPSVYALADLIICRAGATSIAEITALGLASILIPYPFASHNHQEINAMCISDKGGAVMIKQDEIIGDALSNIIKRLYKDRDELKKIEKMAKAFGRPDAASAIADNFYQFIGRTIDGSLGAKQYV